MRIHTHVPRDGGVFWAVGELPSTWPVFAVTNPEGAGGVEIRGFLVKGHDLPNGEGAHYALIAESMLPLPRGKEWIEIREAYAPPPENETEEAKALAEAQPFPVPPFCLPASLDPQDVVPSIRRKWESDYADVAVTVESASEARINVRIRGVFKDGAITELFAWCFSGCPVLFIESGTFTPAKECEYEGTNSEGAAPIQLILEFPEGSRAIEVGPRVRTVRDLGGSIVEELMTLEPHAVTPLHIAVAISPGRIGLELGDVAENGVVVADESEQIALAARDLGRYPFFFAAETSAWKDKGGSYMLSPVVTCSLAEDERLDRAVRDYSYDRPVNYEDDFVRGTLFPFHSAHDASQAGSQPGFGSTFSAAIHSDPDPDNLRLLYFSACEANLRRPNHYCDEAGDLLDFRGTGVETDNHNVVTDPNKGKVSSEVAASQFSITRSWNKTVHSDYESHDAQHYTPGGLVAGYRVSGSPLLRERALRPLFLTDVVDARLLRGWMNPGTRGNGRWPRAVLWVGLHLGEREATLDTLDRFADNILKSAWWVRNNRRGDVVAPLTVTSDGWIPVWEEATVADAWTKVLSILQPGERPHLREKAELIATHAACTTMSFTARDPNGQWWGAYRARVVTPVPVRGYPPSEELDRNYVNTGNEGFAWWQLGAALALITLWDDAREAGQGALHLFPQEAVDELVRRSYAVRRWAMGVDLSSYGGDAPHVRRDFALVSWLEQAGEE